MTKQPELEVVESPYAGGLAYPRSVQVGIPGQEVAYPASLELVTQLEAPVTRMHLGDEVPTGLVRYSVVEAVVMDGQVVALTRWLGGGVFNPQTTH